MRARAQVMFPKLGLGVRLGKKDGPLSLDSGDVLAMLVGRKHMKRHWLERARVT